MEFAQILLIPMLLSIVISSPISYRFLWIFCVDSSGPVQVSGVSNKNIIVHLRTPNTLDNHTVVAQPLQERVLCATSMTVSDRHISLTVYVNERICV